jgi:hypothetical protein
MRQAVKRALLQSLLCHPRRVFINAIQPLQRFCVAAGVQVFDGGKSGG